MNTSKLGVTSMVLSEGRFVLEDSKRLIIAAKTSTQINIKTGFLNFTLNINSTVNKEAEACDINVMADAENNTIDINFINLVYPFYNSIETNSGILLMNKFEVATAGNKIIYIELLIQPIKDSSESCVVDFNIYSGDINDRIKKDNNIEEVEPYDGYHTPGSDVEVIND